MAGEQMETQELSGGGSGRERTELQRDVPMCVHLPIEILNQEQPFPFLDNTLADLGIALSAVKERVVWVDSKRTQVKNKSGKLKEKEVMVLEVRVKAQQPGDPGIQEVIYSTETHTDRSYCRSSVDVLPWKPKHSGSNFSPAQDNDFKPVEMTLALDTETQPKWQKTEEKQKM